MLHGSTLLGLAENWTHPPFAKKAWGGYFDVHLSAGSARLLPGCCRGTGQPLAGPCTVQGLENQHPPSILQVPCSTLQESEAFSADSRASASPPPASGTSSPKCLYMYSTSTASSSSLRPGKLSVTFLFAGPRSTAVFFSSSHLSACRDQDAMPSRLTMTKHHRSSHATNPHHISLPALQLFSLY